MAETTDAQVIKFANERIRTTASKLRDVYWESKRVLEEYNNTGINAKVTAAGSTQVLSDGSQIDGRSRITGDDLFNFVTALQQFVLYVENGTVTKADRTGVITKPSV